MTSYVALVRAVNVGGTGKLSMSDLKAMCEAIGFHAVRTYITSGNVVFRSAWSEPEVKAALKARLQAYAGKPVGVAVRTAAEMAEVLAQNPFPDVPGNRVVAIFLDEVTSPVRFRRCDGSCGRRGASARPSRDLCPLRLRYGGFEAAHPGRDEGHSTQHEYGRQASCHGSY